MSESEKWRTACIITIGNELLKGRTVNTNFSEIARMLTDHGVEVTSGLVVMDTPESIGWAITTALLFCDIIVTSGGLGPTFDDMTLASIGKALGLNMVENKEALALLMGRLEKMHLELTESRRKMAVFPEGSEIIPNTVGSAPGMLLKHEGRIIISLPGVPSEMRTMMASVIPSITDHGFHYFDDSITFPGVMESQLAPFVTDIMRRPGNLAYIKSHPLQAEDRNPGIKVEVSAMTESPAKSREIVESTLNEVKEIVRKILSLET